MSQIPLYTSTMMNVPREARGYSLGEFLFFKWPSTLDNNRFRVLVEDLAGKWVELGTLQEKVYIPAHQFDPHAKLVVVGRNKKDLQIRFVNEMKRGHLYTLGSTEAGTHLMERYVKQNCF
jgi:hypothetical protein